MLRTRLTTALRFVLQRPGSETDRFAFLVAIALVLFFVLDNADYNLIDPWSVAATGGCIVAALLTVRSMPGAGLATIVLALCAGYVNRIMREPWAGSDVLVATQEALETLRSGQNPYLHWFVRTSPPGAPFPYLPGELLFYTIPYSLGHSILFVDRTASFFTLLLLATLVPIVGFARVAIFTALLATFHLVGDRSVDGSNDTSLAFLLTVSIVALAWAAYARGKVPPVVTTILVYTGAVFLSWALLFKALAWPFAPFLIAYVLVHERRHARGFLIATTALVAVTIDVALLGGPGAFISNIARGFSYHVGSSG